jgi:sporulation protein YlmC with PRC-barrel domain
MKKLNMIRAISIAALLASTAALAETPGMTRDMSNTVRKGDVVKSTVKRISLAVINEEPDVRPSVVTIEERNTAKGMIGKTIYNENNHRIGKVHDIILSNDGTAQLIVISNGSFAGMGGKLAAFHYDAIVNRTVKGDMVMPLSQKSIDSAVEFSYKNEEAKDNVSTMPENGYSVANLLKGKILGSDGAKLANIDNLSLKDGRAWLVIAAYNQIFGMGGKKAAVAFKTASFEREDDQVNLKLSAAETTKFRNYKQMTTGKKVSSNY